MLVFIRSIVLHDCFSCQLQAHTGGRGKVKERLAQGSHRFAVSVTLRDQSITRTITDVGSVTILWSQPVGGLQILSPDGQWRWVRHMDNALVRPHQRMVS